MNGFSTVAGYGSPMALSDGSMKDIPVTQLLGLILIELRIQNQLLASGLNVDDPETYAGDSAFSADSSLTNPS